MAVALMGLLAFGLAAAPQALAAQPQVQISDVEDEVMCPVCGTLLELADSPQARREKALVRRLIDEGKSKEEVKDELVVQYGDDVLAVPGGSGFDLSAYLVPAIALLIAVVSLAFGVWRWRRDGDSRSGPPSSGTPDDGDAARLDADIARYDL
ncbi:MAG TPA: cytochrome c-type biogenesis protein CcmH [Solirubrobacterales bacterium]